MTEALHTLNLPDPADQLVYIEQQELDQSRRENTKASEATISTKLILAPAAAFIIGLFASYAANNPEKVFLELYDQNPPNERLLSDYEKNTGTKDSQIIPR